MADKNWLVCSLEQWEDEYQKQIKAHKEILYELRFLHKKVRSQLANARLFDAASMPTRHIHERQESDKAEAKAAMAEDKPVTDAHANHVRVVRAVLQNAANESACSSDTLRWLEQLGFFLPLAEHEPGGIMHEVFQDWDFHEYAKA